MIDHEKFQFLVKQLYATVGELEEMFPGRHFTPDGHLVGSLGECLVADAYNLQLEVASNEGFDAVGPTGVKVEIKATQSDRVSFRSAPEHVIVIKIFPNGTFDEIYNGPGELLREEFKHRPAASNGQFQIPVGKLLALQKSVSPSDRIGRTR